MMISRYGIAALLLGGLPGCVQTNDANNGQHSYALTQTTIIDFETTPDGQPLVEGTAINSQFQSLGATFYLVDVAGEPRIATQGAPALALVADTPSGTIADVAASGVNSLTDASAMSDYGIDFAFPVDSVAVSVIDFGDCVSGVPMGAPVSVSLHAFDAGGSLVASDVFTRPRFPGGAPEDGNIVTLVVSGTGITRVETEGLVLDCGQAIDDVVFTVTVPDACPRTQGFWKNHEESWPVDGLTLGDQLYTQSELLAILATPVRGDASVNLAHQLIAAKLNAANGAAVPDEVADAIADADALLSGLVMPARVRASTALGQDMLAAKDTLDAYNNGAFTDTCEE